MMLDVCHHSCNAAFSSALIYSTGICKFPLRGKSCFLKPPLQREAEKTRQTTSACSVEERRPGRELLTPPCINHSWYFLPGSREMRHHNTEDASTCKCEHVSSSLVESDSMWVSQAHIPEPIPQLLVWYLEGHWPQCHRDWERMGRGGAASPASTQTLHSGRELL